MYEELKGTAYNPNLPDVVQHLNIIFECICNDPVDASGFITPCFVLNSFLCNSVPQLC